MREFQPQLRAHLVADPGPYPVLPREQKKKKCFLGCPHVPGRGCPPGSLEIP